MSLPTGILTFCFTDIEGSSELWELHSDAMPRALAWHDHLVVRTVEAHGGQVVQSMGEGDSTVSVFAEAADAVAAAVALQRALERDGENEMGIAVRIGLNTGPTDVRDGHYFGSTVNLAARVRGLADAGHIFLSAAAHRALGDGVPAGCSIVDLGPHSLKGFAEPEQIYAITAGDLRAPPSTECPYQGLRAYGTEDGGRFFGREHTVADAHRMLRAHGWLCVVGGSGSGKSSFLRAGVAAGWGDALVLTPGATPAPVADGPGLLVVDQLEELWTICAEPPLRDAFIESLLTHDGPVAIGIRADYYGRCADYPALAAKASSHQLLLGAMTEEELRSAIEAPARAYGLRLETGLVELLVREVHSRPGTLPLLSHALLATWERRDGRTLTLDAYSASGGVGAAIAATAESVYAQLDDAERRAAKAVLLRLVEPGEGADDARRRATVDEIASIGTGVPALPVVDALAGARLLTLDDATVELAHEALIREWPRLQAWIDDEREALAMRRHLTTAASSWEQLGRDPSELYSGPRLAALLDWLESEPTLSASERDFANASRAESERVERTRARSVRRLRILVGAVSLALVVAVGAGVFALVKEQDAADSRDRADIARVAAVSRSVVERQPDLGLLLAVAAFELDDNEETRGALLEGLQTHPLLFGLLHGVDSGLEAAVFSPDGETLVTPTSDGTGTIVWSTASRRRIAVLDRGTGILLGAAISPDGRWLAVPAIYERPRPTSRLQVWDLARERLARQLHSPAGALTSAAFSADGETLITQGGPVTTRRFGTEVVLWNTRTWQPRGEPLVLDPAYAGDRTVAVSADGELLAAPRSTGGIRVWSSSARKPVATLAAAAVTALAFAPDASALAIGDDDGGIRFLDPRTAKPGAEPLVVSESAPVAIEYSPDGSRLAVGRRDGRTQIFDVGSGKPLGPPLGANASAINDVSFSADGSLLATAGLDRTGALWRLDGNRAIGTVFGGQRGPITEAVYTRDGAMVLTAATDGSVAARDPETGSIARRFRLGGEVLSIGLSPDGGTLAAGGTAGRVALWPIDDSSAAPISVDLDGAWAQQVAFSPDGEQLAVAADGDRGMWDAGGPTFGQVRFIDPATGREPAAPLTFDHGPPIGVAFSPDGELLAVTLQNNLVRLYDARTHEQVGQPLSNIDSPILSTAFAPDSQLLATGTGSGLILQWDADDQTVLEPPLERDEGAIGGVAYSADGAWLATSRLGFSTTQLWRADTGVPFAGTFVGGALPFTERTFDIEHFIANRPTFSPSGDRLVTTGEDRATVSWTLEPRRWRDAACRIAGRELSEDEWRQYLPDREPHPLCQGGEGPR